MLLPWAFLALLSLALEPIHAAPARRAPTAAVTTAILGAYTAPLSNGSTTLPAPSGLTLKALTLGCGTQNYTCTGPPTDAPAPIGAVATLYDTRQLLPFLPPLTGQDLLNLLPRVLLSLGPDALAGSIVPRAGEHYFSAAGSPVFELAGAASGVFVGKKSAEVAAPADTAAGPHGTIDWLSLDGVDGSSGGLSRAYRTFTAGGKPPATCEGQDAVVAVDYATQYYFFGAE